MLKRDVSFIQYMRAHGNTPGPTQRPKLTGAICGLLGAVISGTVRYWSGALESAAESAGIDFWLVLFVDTTVMTVAGVIYGEIFKRAANDRRGSWLFGMSYGFLLWMLGPVTLWQLISGRPLAVGHAAMGLFAAQLVYGLALGAAYPRVHALLQAKLR